MNTLLTHLPQNNDQIFLTDGGLETTLIFHEGIDLPYFAAFVLISTENGRETLKRYYEPYAALAVRSHTGFILESPTWRANSDWAEKLGYNPEQLAAANHDSISLLKEIKDEFEIPNSPFIISGCIGPRGDGYKVTDMMSATESEAYHRQQILTFAQSGVDLVGAITMTYPDEAIGIVHAAKESNLSVVISFTTETDGRLPNGSSLQEAIETVDAATDNGPAYYMINCAHPDHFRQALEDNATWVQRIQGVRANASRMSHAELDGVEALDSGNPEELGKLYQELRHHFPQFNVLGGCCGTDHRHIGHICQSCLH
ncbi:MAG: homocysteine S-methyltransferase family protein [Amphritea sp.]